MTTHELHMYMDTHFPKDEYGLVDIHSKMKYALAISLTKADIDPEYGNPWWIDDAWKLRDEVAENTIHQYDPVPRNKTTRQLLEEQTVRGKVIQARKELRARMPYVAFDEQYQIILTFLAGNKTDRLFVLKFLDTHWDECYKDEVERLWNLYHEKESARVIVHHFPQQFIRENAEQLSTDYLYLQVLLRLPATLDLDRSRLTDSSYLYYCARKGIRLDDKEAKRLLYQIVADNYYWRQAKWSGKREVVPEDGLYGIAAVGSAVWSLGVLRKTKILLQFYRFERKARGLREKDWRCGFRHELERLHIPIDFTRFDKGPAVYHYLPIEEEKKEEKSEEDKGAEMLSAPIDTISDGEIDVNGWPF